MATPPWPLTVAFDVAEPRVQQGMISLPYDGTLIDRTVGSGWWQCPVTQTVMLAPLPTTAAWRTTFSGNYARYTLANLTTTTSGPWKQHTPTDSGDYWVTRDPLAAGETAADLVAYTTAALLANQGVYISTYTPGKPEGTDSVVLACGWGAENTAGSVWLYFAASGKVQVFKSGDLVGDYDVHDDAVLARSTVATGKTKKQGEWHSYLLQPMRRVSLVVVGDDGGGFEHQFSDLDPDTDANTITPAASFYFYVPQGRTNVQLAPVYYEESATVYSVPHTLRYPPPIGATFLNASAYDRVGPDNGSVLEPTTTVSLAEQDGTAYVPDGTITVLRVKLALTGDGSSSHGLYGVDVYRYPTTTTTADSEFDATCYLRGLQLSVSPDGICSGRIEMHDPDGLVTAGLEQAEYTGDRPLRITIGEAPDPVVDLLRGTASPPEREYAIGAEADAASLLTWEVTDRTRDLADAVLPAFPPLDGLTLSSAVEGLLAGAGYSGGDVDVTADAFVLPYYPSVAKGDWSLLVERGDTVGKWLEKLFGDYASTYFKGWYPDAAGYVYRWGPRTEGTADLELYQSLEDADTAGVTAALQPYRVIRSARITRKRPEANQIIVVGQNPRTWRPILSQYDDADSQDPALLPAARPHNWMGKVVAVVHQDPAIRTQAAADRARDILTARLTKAVVVLQFDSELLVKSDGAPLWVGDRVRVFKEGIADGFTDWRITAIPSMTLAARDETTGETTWRVVYQGELIAPVTADTEAITADSDTMTADAV